MTKKRRTLTLPLLIAISILLAASLGFLLYVTSRPPCRGLGCLQGPKPNPTPGKVDQENIPDWLKGTPRPGRPAVPRGSYDGGH